MRVWLGPRGDLREVPSFPDLTTTVERERSVFVALSGRRVAQAAPRPNGAWSWTVPFGSAGEVSWLRELSCGAVVGPFWLYSSTAAAENLAPLGMQATGSGVIGGRRVLTADDPGRKPTDVPVLPGRSYTVSCLGDGEGRLRVLSGEVTEVRRNYVTDPIGTLKWAEDASSMAGGVASTEPTGGIPECPQFSRISWSAPSTTSTVAFRLSQKVSPDGFGIYVQNYAVPAAGTFQIGFWIRASKAMSVRAIVSGGTLSPPDYFPATSYSTPGVWKRRTATITTNTSGSGVNVVVIFGTGNTPGFWDSGDYVDITGAWIANGTGGFFSGDAAEQGGVVPEWTGAVNRSQSRLLTADQFLILTPAAGGRYSGSLTTDSDAVLRLIPSPGIGQVRVTEGTHVGFAPGDGVPQVDVLDVQRTARIDEHGRTLSDWEITVEEVG